MKIHYDLVIIGAGPAGLAAAIAAAKHRLSVLIIGEQQDPGGQIYRNIENVDSDQVNNQGPEYSRGRSLIKAFRQAKVDYLYDATVWHVQVETTFIVSYILDNDAGQVRSNRLIIATGARERPFAIPGWTLPGVMAATAAEILLKSNNIIPEGDIVLAGSGPLLLLVANHLISAGAPVRAVLDSTPFSNYLVSLKHLPNALRSFAYLYEGIQMIQKIRKHGIQIYNNVKKIEALGGNSVENVRFQHSGRIQEIKTSTLLLHNGLVPDTQMSFLINCDHEWYEIQRYWRPVVDKWGNTSIDGVGVAGDAAGISGGVAAEISGYLAGIEAAFSLKMISDEERDSIAKPLQKQLDRDAHIRPFLDHLFKPSADLLVPRDTQTIVCRCEEVTLQQITTALQSGALNPNQLKAQIRCGMGPCQGRMCGLTVSEIIADYRKMNIADVGYFRIRPPLKPITMEQLSKLQLLGQLENANDIC
ncbi:MAG: FAD-dependent oxidoreductase [Anaerolineales bacterium]|nr:FAD-dependent oxidoreductase [Anaerolineales bacterium]